MVEINRLSPPNNHGILSERNLDLRDAQVVPAAARFADYEEENEKPWNEDKYVDRNEFKGADLHVVSKEHTDQALDVVGTDTAGDDDEEEATESDPRSELGSVENHSDEEETDGSDPDEDATQGSIYKPAKSQDLTVHLQDAAEKFDSKDSETAQEVVSNSAEDENISDINKHNIDSNETEQVQEGTHVDVVSQQKEIDETDQTQPESDATENPDIPEFTPTEITVSEQGSPKQEPGKDYIAERDESEIEPKNEQSDEQLSHDEDETVEIEKEPIELKKEPVDQDQLSFGRGGGLATELRQQTTDEEKEGDEKEDDEDNQQVAEKAQVLTEAVLSENLVARQDDEDDTAVEAMHDNPSNENEEDALAAQAKNDDSADKTAENNLGNIDEDANETEVDEEVQAE